MAIATVVSGVPEGSATLAAVVPALRDTTGAWVGAEVAARAVARAAQLSGRSLALAEAAGSAGSWTRPRGHVLIALGNPQIGPAGKLAWLEMEVTGDDDSARRLRFTLKHTERGWTPLEWGPADNES